MALTVMSKRFIFGKVESIRTLTFFKFSCVRQGEELPHITFCVTVNQRLLFSKIKSFVHVVLDSQMSFCSPFPITVNAELGVFQVTAPAFPTEVDLRMSI